MLPHRAASLLVIASFTLAACNPLKESCYPITVIEVLSTSGRGATLELNCTRLTPSGEIITERSPGPGYIIGPSHFEVFLH
ncbi:hypothetical protein A2899_03350 [Candidatus Amesbacteria bacterium RIFCSPLOWO2_01_FULL_49_25]|uniref:Uncharacterized protein n=1 Tax=Candidatus Amesbacteria bacterium RIFCSPHIGHO2_01_FULL_48_32b TaxID=1797253 RepID=A0A1F4YEU0_9BACT|nr:MAG: hypothetical protein A2876_02310 [Candidatus Amesbacteria bacterium RIFCSPHIGHO2_01_FULL_48_32b]OGD06907.1 MAG: hypothetical protein A2899_03350 [Candidatus Amesbacteria bacterium RIFCSPLOWO2_01_FULL_49_25]